MDLQGSHEGVVMKPAMRIPNNEVRFRCRNRESRARIYCTLKNPQKD